MFVEAADSGQEVQRQEAGRAVGAAAGRELPQRAGHRRASPRPQDRHGRRQPAGACADRSRL